MEFRGHRFKVNKNIARIMKNERLYVTFQDNDDGTVFELDGIVASFLNECDGSNTVEDIIDILKLVIVSEDENKSFSEMLDFLKQHQIIEEA